MRHKLEPCVFKPDFFSEDKLCPTIRQGMEQSNPTARKALVPHFKCIALHRVFFRNGKVSRKSVLRIFGKLGAVLFNSNFRQIAALGEIFVVGYNIPYFLRRSLKPFRYGCSSQKKTSSGFYNNAIIPYCAVKIYIFIIY